MNDSALPTRESILTRKKGFSDSLDKWGFGLALFVGGFGLWFLKYNNFSPWLVTGVPVAVMAIYAAILLLYRKAQLQEDQSGDNLYYLGFLYTLISLALSLHQFDGEKGTAQIITSFGVALATTITGLSLRILFNQMRHDPVEIEREARIELASAASKLQSDLLEVTRTMKTTLLAVQQQTAEVMSGYSKKFDEVAQTIIQKTSESHEQFLDNSKKINQTTTKVVKGIETLLERIDEIHAPTTMIEDKLTPAVNAIALAAEEVRKKASSDGESVVALAEFVKVAIASAQNLGTSIQRVQSETEKTHDTLGHISEVSDKISKAGNVFQAAADNIAKMTTAQRSTQESLDKLVLNLSNKSDSSFKDFSELMKETLTDFKDQGINALGLISSSMNNSLEKYNHTVENLGSSLTNTLEGVKKHNQALAEQLEVSRGYTDKVHSSFVSLTEALTESVNSENNSKLT